MKLTNIFHKQSQLLIDILSYVGDEKCFALKGGTAINFFVQNMPRYSVDIDLVYLPIQPREETLLAIRSATQRIGTKIQATLPDIKTYIDNTKQVAAPKLIAKREDAEVVIEVNPIFRGSVFNPKNMMLCDKVQETFGQFVEMSVASKADLYAGKFCAALTRQHPRDLFDVKLLLEQEGITADIRQAFVVYLACDKRPMHELLSPNIKLFKEQEVLYETEFKGMCVTTPTSYHELSDIANTLASTIGQQLTFEERAFLLSLAKGQPEWDSIPIRHLRDLPALQWKLLNINKMDTDKRNSATHALETVLNKYS